MKSKIAGFYLALSLMLFGQIVVQPPMADRLFPPIKIGTAWKGSPMSKDDVLLPGVVIVTPVKETAGLALHLAELGMALGHFADDPGFYLDSAKEVHLPSYFAKIESMNELATIGSDHVIFIGTNQTAREYFGVDIKGPSIRLIQKLNKNILLLAAPDIIQLKEVISYYARRLYFRASAYQTFFSFVHLRYLLESENFEAAQMLIASVRGISACGRNILMAQPMIASFSVEAKDVVKKRNAILYQKLPQVIQAKNKEQCAKLWKEAMETCYACHQGTESMAPLRKFTVHEIPHSFHQRIGQFYAVSLECQDCHSNKTEIRGYGKE